MTELEGISQLVEATEALDEPDDSSSDSQNESDDSSQEGQPPRRGVLLQVSDVNNNMDTSNLANYGPTMEEHEAHVLDIAAKSSSKSTRNQYGGKMREYYEFSTAIFGDTEITVERVIKFLQFQAHRPKRVGEEDPTDNNEERATDNFQAEFGISRPDQGPPRKKRKFRVKKTRTTGTKKYLFNISDYISVMDHIAQDIQGKDVDQWVHKNRLASIEKYRSAIVKAAPAQTSIAIKLHPGIARIVDNVKRRKKMLLVEEASDKLCRVTEKFRYPGLYKITEEYLWNEYSTKTNWKYYAANTRNRYTFLMTTQTCTRHEATVPCMLSAFEFANLHQPDELEPYPVLFRNLYAGKNHQEDSATIMQAKSFRHKDPKLCEQGALAIYLFVRFYLNDEDFDLTNNQAWNKVRTAVNLNNTPDQFKSSRFKKMKDTHYYDKIGGIFQHFGYNNSHVVHFGRSCLPVLLEVSEVMVAPISQIGGWNYEVYNKHYSLNLPWEALRVAAGFRKEKGFYRLPRNHLKVPLELKKLVYPNVERAKERFYRLPKEQQFTMCSANKFIRFTDHMAEVFIQDICQLRLEGRNRHLLFSHPLFRNELFLQYEKDFQATFSDSNDPRNDPTLNPINQAIPLMGTHMGELKSMVSNGFQSIGRQMHSMGQGLHTLHAMVQQQHASTMHIRHVIQGAVDAHFGSPFLATNDTGESAIDQELTTATVPASPTDNQASPQPSPPVDRTPTQSSIPPFSRLIYESLDKIYDDWFGVGESPYKGHGGIKSLYGKSHFTKTLGDDPNKIKADKKMLQKMRRIGEYFEANSNGNDKESLFRHIRIMIV